MRPTQASKPLRHFARHLFLASKVYAERNKAKKDLDEQLGRMRKSIIRMTLGYSDIDRLKEKIENMIHLERKFAKFFKPDDRESLELKSEINALEQELRNEKESKLRMMSENDEKIKELAESLENIKNKMRHLLMEKAKRQHRLNALEQKIKEKVDHTKYFSS